MSVPPHSPGRPCWAHGTCRDHRHHPASCPMTLGRSQVDAPKEPHGAAGSCSPGRFPPGLGCHHHQAGAERVWLAQCHQESWLLVDCRGPWVACLSHPTQTHRVCVGHPGRAAGRRTKVTASQDGLASETWPRTRWPSSMSRALVTCRRPPREQPSCRKLCVRGLPCLCPQDRCQQGIRFHTGSLPATCSLSSPAVPWGPLPACGRPGLLRLPRTSQVPRAAGESRALVCQEFGGCQGLC